MNIATAIAAVRRRFSDRRLLAEPASTDLLAPLPEPFRGRLISMYADEAQLGADGQRHSLDGVTKISVNQGMWIYQLCIEQNPQNTLEIGMAYGFSTIYFLAAISKNGGGNHTAIDPFQHRAPGIWAGIGVQHAQSLDAQRFRFIEEMSFAGLIRLSSEGRQFEVIFIDGNHLFDAVLVDFTLSAKICPLGGHIILDDTWMPSIRCVVAFIRENRADFMRVSTPVANIAVFRRIATDAREWTHFVEFR